jgi:peptidyl-prolyl cis-trans isomerase B (cyclophilin B)
LLRSRRAALALGAALLLVSVAPSLAAPATKRNVAKKKETKVGKPRDTSKVLAVLNTAQGDVTIRFFRDKAPNHVKNFLELSQKGFYDGTLFHRVIPDFMIQGGDPLTKDPNVPPARYGTGGGSANVKQEFNDVSHKRGVISMARASDPDSASSQFFIVVKDSPFLDRQYTVFGEVVKGMDVVDKLVAESNSDTGDPISGGRPRSYQKMGKVDLVEEEEAPK